VLTRPDVRAVDADDEWKIAENADLTAGAAGELPLLRRHPLKPHVIEDMALEAAAGVVERARRATAQIRRPFQPRAFLIFVVQRAEKRVVIDPPLLALDERSE
jgi:hypothetical protein